LIWTATTGRAARSARALSAASLSLTLYGCLAQPVSIEPPERPRVPRGQVLVRPGRPGFVIAAPQGTDPQTGDLAAELARRTGFGLVVAAGVVADPGYERRVLEAAQGRLVFYAEIHGDARRESAGRIAVATAGVDREFALRLRALLELIRDAHLRGHPSTPKLEIVVEPTDKVFAVAASAKRDEALRPPTRALQVALPRAARLEARESYLAILADFLAQAATQPVGR
jgi:hypothetical protein